VSRPHPDTACHGKKRYGRKAAHRAARVLHQRQGQQVHAYPCPHCGRWHVGHPVPTDWLDTRDSA
jgi:hypothetical protein